MSFPDLGVSADLVAALAARGITTPFPVQSATIGDALAGRDLCVQAPTGSGKTLAFAIPLVTRVARAAPKQPRALVLAPTRELAAQISAELKPLAEARGRRVFTVYGGVGYEPQRHALRRGVDILVACPGRLKDLVDQHVVRLDKVDMVVVDEADRMADMGFLPEVRRLLDQTPATRQTMLFSATLEGDVALLTQRYQREPAHHAVDAVDERRDDLEHRFVELAPAAFVAHTAALIRAEGPTIVFCRTRHRADRVAKQLRAAGIEAAAIHGGLSQNKRDQALDRFKRAGVAALVATDIAARGIHVDAVACVVHFDLAADATAYIHRSGRTGRAGAGGSVVTLVADDQRSAARALQQQLFRAGHTTSEPKGQRPAARRDDLTRAHRRGGARVRTRRR